MSTGRRLAARHELVGRRRVANAKLTNTLFGVREY